MRAAKPKAKTVPIRSYSALQDDYHKVLKDNALLRTERDSSEARASIFQKENEVLRAEARARVELRSDRFIETTRLLRVLSAHEPRERIGKKLLREINVLYRWWNFGLPPSQQGSK